jgi:Zn-dependent peptidase ImmA (M78 family)
MASSGFSIDVNPDVLRWARTSSGKDVSEIARKASISEQTLRKWESGEKPPTWLKLKRLAQLYQRPVATLLLPAPPSDPDTPTDFRSKQGARRTLSSTTLLTIRTAQWLQDRASEMRRELGVKPSFAGKSISPEADHSAAARRERARLGVALDSQLVWPSAREAFRSWKSSLAELGVFVFQFRFPRDEVQGFSLFDKSAPVIVVNEEDAIEARIFTLFHEYAHLLMRKPGLCMPHDVSAPWERNIESFCNRFASSLLIPDSEVDSWRFALGSSAASNDDAVKKIAQRYRVSKDVVLIKLKTGGRITDAEFDRIYSRWKRARTSDVSGRRKPPTKQSKGPSAWQKCTYQRGWSFIELVNESLVRGAITDRDAMAYLNIKLKDLDKLARRS